jgi:hypothetical protein
MVEKITASISDGLIPALAMASLLASTAMSIKDLFLLARILVMIPVRCLIHSSDELIGPAMSSLVTVRSPRDAPRE